MRDEHAWQAPLQVALSRADALRHFGWRWHPSAAIG
jgi:hypothetical protein